MTRFSLTAAIALALSATLITPSFAQKKYDTGATDTEIKIGQSLALSGPASAYATIGKTQAAYFQMINDQGGINGRKINFISYDDGYTPPKTVEMVRNLVEQDNVLLVASPLGTPTNSAIWHYMNQKKVPQLFVATGATKWDDPKGHPWTIGWQPNYQSEGRIYASYILEHKPDGKIGVLYQNDDFGKDYLTGLRQGLGDKADKSIVATQSYETTDPTMDSQIVALQERLRRDGRALRLSGNFRSHAEILAVVDGLFDPLLEDFESPRAVGALESDAFPPPRVELLLADRTSIDVPRPLISDGMPAGKPYRLAEARLLARRIAELVADGCRPGRIAILMRSGTGASTFERALQLEGIPVVSTTGSFWSHEQVADLIAVLRVVANARDEEALYGVLASPLGGLSFDSLALLSDGARAGDRPLWEHCLGESAAAPLAALDLPLKVLIWSDEGQTKVTYTAPTALAARYGLGQELAVRLAGIDGLTDSLVDG